MEFCRRSLLKGIGAAGVASVIPVKQSKAESRPGSYATMIDLTICDGCVDRKLPICISACRNENRHRYPEPDPKLLKPYWPQKRFEDWSQKREVTSRLTPYNWIFVQTVQVEIDGKRITEHVPRRCMHCDNPPCANLCPFGSMAQMREGPVYVKEYSCVGGAKCRSVCPWSVPQRQAGVGIYRYLDPMPVGGGVMYKCDLCRSRLSGGKKPACIEKCPQGAMKIGTRSQIYEDAEKRRAEVEGFIYGKSQNGGTSTLYVSNIPFEKLNKAILKQAKDPKKVMALHNPENMTEKYSDWAVAAIAAPVVGALGAFASTIAKEERKK